MILALQAQTHNRVTWQLDNVKLLLITVILNAASSSKIDLLCSFPLETTQNCQ
ncbi:hypothetical protein Fmac_003247 [Flemingia macrophylla]|uniref:Uncharacterized protein n=1 Tax=Flemingia macrophylla TaxID=520843 RepID=A0ABD1NNN8_9FABA